MNCLQVMKIKWSLDINTGAVERSEAARARRLVGATVVGDDVIASTGYMKKQPPLRYPRLSPIFPTEPKPSSGLSLAIALAIPYVNHEFLMETHLHCTSMSSWVHIILLYITSPHGCTLF